MKSCTKVNALVIYTLLFFFPFKAFAQSDVQKEIREYQKETKKNY